jgi:hypothetical protein
LGYCFFSAWLLGWAENNREACLRNLGPLSSVARAFGSQESGARNQESGVRSQQPEKGRPSPNKIEAEKKDPGAIDSATSEQAGTVTSPLSPGGRGAGGEGGPDKKDDLSRRIHREADRLHTTHSAKELPGIRLIPAGIAWISGRTRVLILS